MPELRLPRATPLPFPDIFPPLDAAPAKPQKKPELLKPSAVPGSFPHVKPEDRPAPYSRQKQNTARSLACLAAGFGLNAVFMGALYGLDEPAFARRICADVRASVSQFLHKNF